MTPITVAIVRAICIWSKEIRSDNLCYRKVGRAITLWGVIDGKTLLHCNIRKMNEFTQHQKSFHIIWGAPIIFSLTVIKLIVMASAHTYLVLVLVLLLLPNKKSSL